MAIPIIHDGDHGSDDFVASLVALGRKDVFDLLGITTCHGNVRVESAARNARLAVEMAGEHATPVCQGAHRPRRIEPKIGDNAFGENGIGGVVFPDPTTAPLGIPGHDWLIKTLQEAPDPVTVCVTGPMTNIARLLDEAPQVRSKIERIIAMGGCLGPLGPSKRRGNITPHAEFNFYLDPDAADYVLRSDVPVVLLPMDVTHELIFTKDRQRLAIQKWKSESGERIVRMLTAVEPLDRRNFGLDGAVVHDLHVFLYLIAPELYTSEQTEVHVITEEDHEEHGSLVRSRSGSEIQTVIGLKDADAAFELLIGAVASALEGNHSKAIAE